MQPPSPEIKTETKLSDLPRDLARLIVRGVQPVPTFQVKTFTLIDRWDRKHDMVQYTIARGQKEKWVHSIPVEFFQVEEIKIKEFKRDTEAFFKKDSKDTLLSITGAAPEALSPILDLEYFICELSRQKGMLYLRAGCGIDNGDIDYTAVNVALTEEKYGKVLREMLADIIQRMENAPREEN